MRKESWNDPVAWIVSRSDSGALALGFYPSAAGPLCLPACSLNQHVILRKEIKMGYFAGGISLVAVLERERERKKSR